MNLIDATVIKVIDVYTEYGKWWVEAKVSSWGRDSMTALMFETEEEARQVDIGYECVI